MKKLAWVLLPFAIFSSCKKENDDKYPLYPPPEYFFTESANITPSLYVPSAFSPNYDGINDIFMPYGNRIYLISVVVFSSLESGTSGKEVYIYGRNNTFSHWDGKDFNKNECTTGSYPYRIKYVTKTGETNVVRGLVHLYRY